MQRTDSTRKLERPYDGLYEITKVFTNGTVAIQKGIVNECVNIRRVFLYCQAPNREVSAQCVRTYRIRLIMNPIGLGLCIGSMGLDHRNSIGLEY